jgi:hypothetical protein
MRRQCMIMLIWLHVNQTLLRIVFTYTLIYRKVSTLHMTRITDFVHNGQKMLVQSSPIYRSFTVCTCNVGVCIPLT